MTLPSKENTNVKLVSFELQWIPFEIMLVRLVWLFSYSMKKNYEYFTFRKQQLDSISA